MIQLLFIISSIFIQPIINRRSFVTNSISFPFYKSVFNNDNDDSSGLIRINNNNIYYSGSLTDETIFAITSNLLTLQNEDKINNINLHIQSQGGSLLPSLGLIDLIKNSDKPINTYVMGYAASAASLISVVGNKRYLNKHGVMLIHQLKMGIEYSKYKEIEDQHQNAYTLMNIIKEIYLENTKLTLDKLDELLEHDYWLNSSTCLQYGLIDEIL